MFDWRSATVPRTACLPGIGRLVTQTTQGNATRGASNSQTLTVRRSLLTRGMPVFTRGSWRLDLAWSDSPYGLIYQASSSGSAPSPCIPAASIPKIAARISCLDRPRNFSCSSPQTIPTARVRGVVNWDNKPRSADQHLVNAATARIITYRYTTVGVILRVRQWAFSLL